MAEYDDEDWTILAPAEAACAVEELESIRQHFDDEVDMFDTTMVAEYADDIFAHMEAMEQSVMPNPKYMDFQTEIEW
jgi:G2/mitotic-specific cyclin 1/2